MLTPAEAKCLICCAKIRAQLKIWEGIAANREGMVGREAYLERVAAAGDRFAGDADAALDELDLKPGVDPRGRD